MDKLAKVLWAIGAGLAQGVWKYPPPGAEREKAPPPIEPGQQIPHANENTFAWGD